MNIQDQSFCNLFLHFRSKKISGLRPSDSQFQFYSTKMSGLRLYGSTYYLRSTTIQDQSSFGFRFGYRSTKISGLRPSDSQLYTFLLRYQGYAPRMLEYLHTLNDKLRAAQRFVIPSFFYEVMKAYRCGCE